MKKSILAVDNKKEYTIDQCALMKNVPTLKNIDHYEGEIMHTSTTDVSKQYASLVDIEDVGQSFSERNLTFFIGFKM